MSAHPDPYLHGFWHGREVQASEDRAHKNVRLLFLVAVSLAAFILGMMVGARIVERSFVNGKAQAPLHLR